MLLKPRSWKFRGRYKRILLSRTSCSISVNSNPPLQIFNADPLSASPLFAHLIHRIQIPGQFLHISKTRCLTISLIHETQLVLWNLIFFKNFGRFAVWFKELGLLNSFFIWEMCKCLRGIWKSTFKGLGHLPDVFLSGWSPIKDYLSTPRYQN